MAKFPTSVCAFVLLILMVTAVPGHSASKDMLSRYIESSNYKAASKYVVEKSGHSHSERFALHMYDGILKRIYGDYFGASDSFAQAAKMLEGSRDISKVGWFYREKGVLHFLAGSTARAEKYLNQSIEWFSDGGSAYQKDLALSRVYAAHIKSRRGNPNQAVFSLRRMAQNSDPKVGALASLALADVQAFLNNRKDVLPAIRKAESYLRNGGLSIYLNQDMFDLVSSQLIVENGLLPAGQQEKYISLLINRMEVAIDDGSIIQLKRVSHYQDVVRRVALGLLQSSGGKRESVFRLAQLVGMTTVSSAYAHGVGGKSITSSIQSLQHALKPDEAILQYIFGQTGGYGRFYDKGYCLYITKKRHGVVKLQKRTREIKEQVDRLRAAFDLSKVQLYPASTAHSLYKDIFKDVRREIGSKVTSLYVLPDGPLEKIPFSVLLTEEVKQIKDYRKLPWFVKKFAVSLIPSYQALVSSSGSRVAFNAVPSFVGFGDPVLGGGNDWQRGIQVKHIYTGQGVTNSTKLSRLSNLPETRGELNEISLTLNKGKRSKIFVGRQATEAQIRRAYLADNDILMFATHGLVAGDFSWLNEPALVLTPVNDSDPHNDGLLKASEIAQLKIGSKIVVLSACNTASGDGSDTGVGLSGLAQGFFYAGANCVLVSHWSVESRAAVLLTTFTMAEYKKRPEAGFSRALQKAMLRVMDERFPAPAFWAPFVVVGGKQ